MWKKNSSQNEPIQPPSPPKMPTSLATPGEESKAVHKPLISGSASSEEARIGKTIVVKGDITGAGNVYIDGTVEGTINLPEHRVIVGGNGQVTATISAREIVVHGTVTGNVEASDFLDLRNDGSLIGDAIAHRISIEDGADFKGKLERRRYLRHKVTAPVQLSRNGKQLNASLANLSETGMTVVSQEPLESGSNLEFSVHLPDGPVVKGTGEIVWTNRDGNVGIQFRKLSDAANVDLSRWLAARADKSDGAS